MRCYVAMVSFSPEIQRKFNQVDNDIESIYFMLSDISITQKRHGNRLQEIGERQEQHGAILGEHRATLASHTATLASQSAKLDEILALLRSDR